VKLKYRLLFCPKRRAKPGPKGPTQDLIHAVVEMKLRNPDWGCPRIAAQISLAFGVLINKDVVRRILATHYHPSPDAGGGPSLSHPFVERLIGTIRREYLDRTLFWTAIDLESKLSEFMDYYNRHRAHASLDGETPEQNPESERRASLISSAWREHCRGLFHTPTAA
jgi:hypothetical protein